MTEHFLPIEKGTKLLKVLQVSESSGLRHFLCSHMGACTKVHFQKVYIGTLQNYTALSYICIHEQVGNKRGRKFWQVTCCHNLLESGTPQQDKVYEKWYTNHASHGFKYLHEAHFTQEYSWTPCYIAQKQ